MKYFVSMTSYFSTDWHDWKEKLAFLGSKEKRYEFDSKDDARKAILENIWDTLEFCWDKLKCRDSEKNKLTYEEAQKMVYSGENFILESCLMFPDGETVGEDVLLKCEESDVYELFRDSCYTNNIYYRILSIDEDDIRYIPTRSYICWPKLTPLAQRAMSECTDSFEKALATKAPAYMDKTAGFLEFEDIVVIDSRDALEKNKWYQKQMTLKEKLESLPAELQYELYHPISTAQEDKLKEYFPNM